MELLIRTEAGARSANNTHWIDQVLVLTNIVIGAT
jgi:multisubunit Na+/H+ antiporter MnhC subunit